MLLLWVPEKHVAEIMMIIGGGHANVGLLCY